MNDQEFRDGLNRHMGKQTQHMEQTNARLMTIETGMVESRQETDRKISAVHRRIDNLRSAGYVGALIASVLGWLGIR